MRNGLMCAAVFMVFVITGCGGRGLHRVQGLVTLDGAPLAEAQITFHPPADSPLRPAGGTTDAHGRFQLGSFDPGDGVAPGEYRVTVVKYLAPPSENVPQAGAAAFRPGPVPAPELALPALYTEPASTPLSVKVPVSGSCALELKSSAAP